MSYLSDIKTATEIQGELALAARARRLAMNLTQAELSARSGVPIATLRRFEGGGPASVATLLAVAEALDALPGFAGLFRPPEPATLDELAAPPRRRSRARKRGAP